RGSDPPTATLRNSEVWRPEQQRDRDFPGYIPPCLVPLSRRNRRAALLPSRCGYPCLRRIPAQNAVGSARSKSWGQGEVGPPLPQRSSILVREHDRYHGPAVVAGAAQGLEPHQRRGTVLVVVADLKTKRPSAPVERGAASRGPLQTGSGRGTRVPHSLAPEGSLEAQV